MSKPELSPQGRKLVQLFLSNNIWKGKENTDRRKEGAALPGGSTLPTLLGQTMGPTALAFCGSRPNPLVLCSSVFHMQTGTSLALVSPYPLEILQYSKCP